MGDGRSEPEGMPSAAGLWVRLVADGAVNPT
jgi:hypothetical protein